MSTTSFSSRACVFAVVVCASAQLANAADGIDASIQTLAKALNGDLQNRGAKKLAIFDFIDIRGYRSALDAFLAEELTTQLVRTAPGKFTFIERRQLGRVLEEQKRTASNNFDQTTLANVGRIFGLDTMITGTIADLGTEIRVNARAITIQTGEVFAAASVALAKEGPVAELLRQNGRPEDHGSTPAVGRTVQPTDVVFENHLIRLTVANANVSPDKHNVTLTLILENLASAELFLAFPMAAGVFHCGIGINNGSGELLRVDRSDITGLPCVHTSTSEYKHEMFASVAPRARTTVTVRAFSQQAPGNLLAVSLEFINFDNGKPARFSAGIANIQAK